VIIYYLYLLLLTLEFSTTNTNFGRPWLEAR